MKYSALALLLAVRAFAAENGLPDFLPPGTKVMFGVQVRRILNSSLVQGISPTTAAGAFSGVAPNGADWQKIVSLAGFDPFQDIEELLLASSAEGQNPPMLVIARGNFNLERFSANARPYHSVPVLVNGKSSTGAIALLDASTAILGEIAEVHAAIDRRSSHAGLDPALVARLTDLRSGYDIWGVGNDIANLVPPSSQPDGMDSIDRFQFGLSLTHGLELAAEVHARSSKDAEKLKQAAQFLEFMLKSQPGSDAAKLNIHEDHGTLKLALTISEEDLKKVVEARRAELVRKPADTQVKITAPAGSTQSNLAPPGITIFTLPGKHL